MSAPHTNGQARPLAELREEYARMRLETRIAEARARHGQAQLLESFYAGFSSFTGGLNSFVDPMDRFRDGDQWIYSPLGGLNDRQHGRDGPFIYDEVQLAECRNVARYIGHKNPFGVGAVETICDFVVGTGMVPMVLSKEGASAELLAECQDVVDDFWDLNEFSELQQELVNRRVVDGEYFLRHFPEDDQLDLRLVEPEYVRQPLGSPIEEWSWGIKNPPGDVAKATAFAVFRSENNLDEWDEVKAGEVVHVKGNVYRNIKRGLSDFYATADGLEGVRKLLRNMREGEAIRAAIAGFWEYELAGSATVTRHVQQTQDSLQPYLNNPITGKTYNAQKFDPGSILHVPKGKKFIPPPASSASAGQTAAIQAVLRSLGVRWGMSESMVSADASNNAYASELMAGARFPRRVERWQAFFKVRFLRTIWRALETAYDAGRIGRGKTWEEVRYLVDVQLEAPTPVIANELQQTQADDIDLKNGVLSKKTRCLRRGLDYEQERENIRKDPVTPPPQPGAPPGGQGGGAQGFFPRVNRPA